MDIIVIEQVNSYTAETNSIQMKLSATYKKRNGPGLCSASSFTTNGVEALGYPVRELVT
jgi:hypothetical protein